MQPRASRTPSDFSETKHEVLHLFGSHILVLEEDNSTLRNSDSKVTDEPLIPLQQITDLKSSVFTTNYGGDVELLDVVKASRVSQWLRDPRPTLWVTTEDVVAQGGICL